MSTVGLHSIKAVGKANGEGHCWFQLYWYVLSSSSLHSSHDNPFPFTPFPCPLLHPYEQAIMRLLLCCVKAAGFTANVKTLGTFLLHWCSHDLDTATVPSWEGLPVVDPNAEREAGVDPFFQVVVVVVFAGNGLASRQAVWALAMCRRTSCRVVTCQLRSLPHMGQPRILAWKQG
jgi:hypothetical protein